MKEVDLRTLERHCGVSTNGFTKDKTIQKSGALILYMGYPIYNS